LRHVKPAIIGLQQSGSLRLLLIIHTSHISMARNATLLSALALLLIAPAGFAKKHTVRRALPMHFAGNNTSSKATGITNPVLAEAVYDYSLSPAAQLTDSMRIFYNSGRGSAFDFDNLYYDYSNPADDPSNRLLISSYLNYDTVVVYNPPGSANAHTAATRSYNAAAKLARAFVDGDQIVYYNYDTVTGRLSNTVSAVFNGTSYDTAIRHTYTYGTYGSVTRDSTFSRVNKAWKPTGIVVTVNGNSSYPQQRTENIITGTTLKPMSRTFYNYYPSFRPNSIVHLVNSGGNNLRNDLQDSFYYAANNMLIAHNGYSWDSSSATWNLSSQEYRHLDSIFSQPDSVWLRYDNGMGSFDTLIQKLAYNDAGDPIYLRSYAANGQTLLDEVRWYYRLTINGHPPVGINSTSKAALLVYPNPASEMLYVKGVPAPTPYGIYNTAGQMVQSGSINAANEIPVANLPAGTYFIRTQTLEGQRSGTFVHH
jgi:hypothetical protein